MKKGIINLSVIVALLMSPVFFVQSGVHAEDETEPEQSAEESADQTGTNISLTPVSKTYQLSGSSVYNDSFTVNNTGGRELEIEVFAAPYSYVYSEQNDTYQLGFSK